MIVHQESAEESKKNSFHLLYFLFFIFIAVTIICYAEVFIKRTSFFYDSVSSARKMFYSPLVVKLILLFFSFATITLYTIGGTIEKERRKTMFSFGMLFLALYVFLMVLEIFFKVNSIVGVGLHSLFYISGVYCLLQWKKREAVDLKNDRRLEVEAEFEQQRELVDTPISVNIPYEYSYLGEERLSWINVVNPFRGSLVGGTPGSGKSFAIIDEYLRQQVSKGFAMAMYDFKYPTLTRKLYNYYWWYQEKYKVIPSFYVVNFEKPEYSHRCNPINIDSLKTIADAAENIKVLMYNINRDWIEKQGDFFIDSAIEYTTMLLWYLKLVSLKYNYNVCTLPHLIALSTFESTEIMFFILQEYNDLKAKMKPFSEALEKGAMEQLAGQVASAGVALSKIASKEVNYIMTGDDFTFDINNPLLPKIVCLGNSPQLKETYSPVLGLVLSKIAKEINAEGKCPTGFSVDEFPTIFIKGVDELIATGRSNKVATLLGFQSFAQIEAGYGKLISDNITRICGSRIMGQMMDNDAEMISTTIGKQKILQRSYNYSTNEVSENQQVNLESIVPPERIAQFTQGVFCGVIADDFKYQEPNKVFYGKMKPPVELKNRENDIKLPQLRKFIDDDELSEKTSNYLIDNEPILKKLVPILAEKTINEWKFIFEKENTFDKFSEYLIKNYHFDYEIKKITEFLRIKDVFQEFIIEELDKEERKYISSAEKQQAYIDFSNQCFSEVVMEKQIKEWIKEAIKFDAREKYLVDYTQQIYNDVYRIVSLELLDLDLANQLKSNQNREVRNRTIQLLKRILKRDKKFNEEITTKRFESIISILESDDDEE